ncbi:dethiobiotin synthase [Halomonas llamarensis]|uniref:ATP-dependent dethiobiotin synthetase BioD n=1 Tax=Halomonas llamarensis TaxID=2945104 RepID=A0ABT0SPR4_9GAMM|nr:dethiobiotin synthase [Halomonas llamarensis]MCL7929450.1 dethiobiotin synthase [Halomonas llamarensis]
MSTFFVTGTDTDAGKTLVTSTLLATASAQGLTTLGLKPVASGSRVTPVGLRNSDALALQVQSMPPVSYATVNPWVFEPAIAPHLAASEASQALNVSDIVATLGATLAQTQRDLTLIEGAGGWRVPLNDRDDFCDIPRLMQLPVILVVGLKLGCLNHARLTAEAIAADGLTIAGWVGSVVDPAFTSESTRFAANLDVLKQTLPASCLGIIPHLEQPSPETAQPYLSLPPLRTLETP